CLCVRSQSSPGVLIIFFFSSRRRHTRSKRDWSSDVCSSDLDEPLSDDQSWELVAPSPLAYSEAKKNRVPREMTRADMDRVIAERSEERRVGKECRSRGAPDQ